MTPQKRGGNKQPRIALVCDWLTNVGGAESVLLTLHQMYKDAPIYTSKYDKRGIDWFLDADVRTGWLQIFPTSLRRFLSPLRQRYFSRLDLSDYDLVISVTGAEAKFVKTKKTERKLKKSERTEHEDSHSCIHLCYCHVPTQYYWKMYEDYLENPGFGVLNPLARLALKLFIKPLRRNDFAAAKRPDQFITISGYAAEQIKKYYKRESIIIYPPADLKKFSTEFSTSSKMKQGNCQVKKPYNYITTSRQVNWKRIDLCVKACLETGDNLTVIGDGPEHNNLVKLANGASNIKFLPQMSQTELKKKLVQADAYLFPSLEPFGLAPIEAMACGVPVIAFGEGGALDYIKPGKNGLLFDRQTTNSLISAMEKFNPENFDKSVVKQSVVPFGKDRFIKSIEAVVNEKIH